MVARSVCTILLLLLTSIGSVPGQSSKRCVSYNSSVAQQDVTSDKPRLLLQGGFAPVRRAEDSSIEKQFGFMYEDFGCVRPADDSCLREYSQVVFTYLDKKYGIAWRTRVRKDVLFLTVFPNPSNQ
ncbi:FEKKY domain-containing protein [Spirosoma areae]